MTRPERWLLIIVATFVICLLGQIASNTTPTPKTESCIYHPNKIVTCS